MERMLAAEVCPARLARSWLGVLVKMPARTVNPAKDPPVEVVIPVLAPNAGGK